MSKYFSTGADLQAALNALPASKTGSFTAFDPFFYGQTYMASYAGDLSPIDHFVKVGAALGYKPNASFDPAYYQTNSTDLGGLDGADLLYHFTMYGLDEGRVPNASLAAFDGNAYLEANSDVKGYVEANLDQFGGSLTNGALAHYVKFGAAEGRPAALVVVGEIDLVEGTIDPVVATAEADTFTFDVVAALALATPDTQTQITISDFDVAADALLIDTATASPAVTTLADLDGVDGITVFANVITNETLVNFGPDADGDVVAIALAGVIDPSLVNISVI